MASSNDPIFNLLASQLSSLGLGALFTVGPNGEPGGWLMDQLRQGFDTSDELMLALANTDVFRNRFGVITEQQRRAAAGQPEYVMSPAEVIEYETKIRQTAQAAGVPAWMFDTPEEIGKLILNNISANEFAQRVQQTYDYVRVAPPEVRSYFEQFAGVGQGDSMLAAYVLNPERTISQLDQIRRSAYTAGMADRFDVAITRQAAEQIAQLPQTEAGIVEGLRQVAAQSALYDEGLFETGDLTAAREGVASVFEGDAAATTALQRRQATRAAVDRAATGGAAVTQRGVVGAGSAGGR